MFQKDQSNTTGSNPYEVKSETTEPQNPYEMFQQEQSEYSNNNPYGMLEQELKDMECKITNDPYQMYQMQQSKEQMSYHPESEESRFFYVKN